MERTRSDKKWPRDGPKLLWENDGMGDGYSSPTVTDNAVYITGRKWKLIDAGSFHIPHFY